MNFNNSLWTTVWFPLRVLMNTLWLVCPLWAVKIHRRLFFCISFVVGSADKGRDRWISVNLVNLIRWLNTELILHTFPRLLVITNPSHVSFGCLALFVPTIVSQWQWCWWWRGAWLVRGRATCCSAGPPLWRENEVLVRGARRRGVYNLT